MSSSETLSNQRQTWGLDAAQRYRGWTKESYNGSVWTQTASRTNHYGDDADNPRWIVEDTATGAVTRNLATVGGLATTSKTGDVLHLTTIQGSVAVQLPLDVSQAPVALDADEYGKPRAGQAATRYGWLGAHQRSSETPSGLTLMAPASTIRPPAASSPRTRSTAEARTPTSTPTPTRSTSRRRQPLVLQQYFVA